MKERDKNIDAIRGFAIILVVIGHIIQFICLPKSFDNSYIWKFIYSFHMPLFMFISGYLCYKNEKKLDSKWLFHKFKHLVVPFIIWTILDYFITMPSINIIEYLKETSMYPDYSLWFLLILFYNCIVLYISNNSKYQTLVYILLIILIKILPFELYGFSLLKWHITFFSFGYFANKYKHLWIKYKKQISIISLIIFLLLVPFWNRLTLPSFSIYLNKINPVISNIIYTLYKYIVPITAISFIFNYSIKTKKVQDILSTLGLYTIEIYILHPYFLEFLLTKNIYINIILTLILSFTIPIIISNNLKNKLINKALFGKN